MLFSVEQAFVGRDEIQASLKMPAWRLVKVRSIQKVLPQCCALLQVSCERRDQIFY